MLMDIPKEMAFYQHIIDAIQRDNKNHPKITPQLILCQQERIITTKMNA